MKGQLLIKNAANVIALLIELTPTIMCMKIQVD